MSVRPLHIRPPPPTRDFHACVNIRPANNFLSQVIGSASEGKYNTVNNSTSGEVTFQKWLNLGIRPTLFSSKIATSHKRSPLGPTRAYI